MASLLSRIGAAFKGLGHRHAPASAGWTSLFAPRTAIDFLGEAGRVEENSIVAAILGWLSDNWVEAPPFVAEVAADGTEERVVGHPLERLLDRPNPHYSSHELWAATLADLKVNSGNAYWHIVRNSSGVPVELYWMPASTVEPRWDERDPYEYIGWYDYQTSGRTERLDPADVVHFREGVDPSNERKGFCRLRSAIREVFTDNEAANAVAITLRNRGVIAVSFSPDFSGMKDAQIRPLTPEQSEALERKMLAKTSGDNRGGYIVHSIPVTAQELGAGLAEMASREIRRIPEERICAILRIPPGVVKLGAGLDRNTMANAKTEQEQAWRNGLLPIHTLVRSPIERVLLPAFEREPDRFALRFDTSNVQALLPDLKLLAETFQPLWETDVVTRAEYREQLNLTVSPEDEVRYSQVRTSVDEASKQLRREASARARARREALEASGAAE